MTHATVARPVPSTSPRTDNRQRMDMAEAGRRLQQLATKRRATNEFLSELVGIVAELTGALGVAYLTRDASQRLTIAPGHYAPPQLGQLRSLLQIMLRVSTIAASEQAPQATTAETGGEILVISVPVTTELHGPEAVSLAVGLNSTNEAPRTSAYLIQLLTWVAAFAGSVQGDATSQDDVEASNNLTSANSAWERLSVALREAARSGSFRKSAQVVADWLREETNSSVVAVGVRGLRRQTCRIVGYSELQGFDERSGTVQQIQEVMEETVIAAEFAPTDSPDETLLDTSALAALRSSAGLHVVQRHVIHDFQGAPCGAVLLLADTERPTELDATGQAQLPPQVWKLLGTGLALLRDAEPSWLDRLLGWRAKGTPWYARQATWSIFAGIVLLLLLPMPLNVHCSCLVQPQQRRFVSVPYDGRLQEALTEPGELVKQGQLLARMDGREIEWELAGLVADLGRVEKDRDTALAAYDTAAAQMAGLEAKRLQLQIDLLGSRLENLEIRSPVDGMVIGGDPRKIEGARMSMGQTILEVGPLDRMIVELEIPDEEVSHISAGQGVKYRLAELPWKNMEAEIERIQPRAEVRDEANVFIAEFTVDNDQLDMRPGMRGQAKVTTDWHPLGWNLFHRAWYGLLTRLGW